MKYLTSPFISGAANTVSSSVTWLPSSLQKVIPAGVIAYGLTNGIAIVENTDPVSLICTLRSGHVEDNRINALTSTMEHDGSILLMSGSEKGTLNTWYLSKESIEQKDLTNWKLLETNIHKEKVSIQSLCSLSFLEKTTQQTIVLLCVSYANGELMIQQTSGMEGKWKTVHTMRYNPNQLPNAVKLAPLNDEDLVGLFIGCVDARVYVYTALHSSFVESEIPSDLFKNGGTLVGHEEWITSLAFTHYPAVIVNGEEVASEEVLLASSSQDMKIRVWKFVANASTVPEIDAALISAAMETAAAEAEEEAVEGEEIGPSAILIEDESRNSEARLRFVAANGRSYAVFLESLLVGHEDWVSSIHWLPRQPFTHEVRLYSTSMDRNMIIWAPDASAGGVWLPSIRVGDVGGSLGGSVGGNLLGFVAGCVSPDGNRLLGVGYGGTLHCWQRDTTLDTADEISSRWYPIPFLSGHFQEVTDVAWDPSNGEYIVSVSADQTCRLYAPVLPERLPSARAVSAKENPLESAVWKEISRPEIHGYDLHCLTLLPPADGRGTLIYTAGEEKLIRIFEASASVCSGIQEICGITLLTGATGQAVEEAYIPELGLSNKGKGHMTEEERQEFDARGVSAIDWKRGAPLEGQLVDHTLWLELRKLFGHSDEVVCLAHSPVDPFVASSSKARNRQQSGVLLWNTSTNLEVTRMSGHESTAVCLEFSPNGEYLASAGKDRAICLYRRSVEGDNVSFALDLCAKSVHKRIVWDLSWSPDSQFLASVARDGWCKIWRVEQTSEGLNLIVEASIQPFDGVAVTAVDFLSRSVSKDGQAEWLLAFGSERGDIRLATLPNATLGAVTVELGALVPNHYAHTKAVKRLRWKPSVSEGLKHLQLASCGEDHTVRLHVFDLENHSV